MHQHNNVLKRLLKGAGLWIRGKKSHDVEFHGRKFTVVSRKKRSIPAQQYVEHNGVLCGSCNSLILPGSKIWVCQPLTDSDLKRPGVLPVDLGNGKQGLAACLDWDCCPTAGLMCGELREGRKIAFFESPIAQAARTGEVVIVQSVEDYPD